MPRFFCEDISDHMGVITGEDAVHISRSLRMKPGESITLCDGRGTDYEGQIESVQGDCVRVQVAEIHPTMAEPPVAVTLFQGLPKGDKFELIVQKAVELGAVAIVPVLTEFCVSRPEPKAMAGKLARWNKIALEAAKQSGRGIISAVEPLISYSEALARMKTFGLPILFYENATGHYSRLLEAHPAPQSIGMLVGPEGGFSPAEAEQARAMDMAVASLGPRILRCETAGLCAIAVAVQHYEGALTR